MADFDFQIDPNTAAIYGIPASTPLNLVGPIVYPPTGVDWGSILGTIGDGAAALTNSVGSGVTGVLSNAEKSAADATASAAGTVAKSILPYVIVTGGILAGLMVLNKSR